MGWREKCKGRWEVREETKINSGRETGKNNKKREE